MYIIKTADLFIALCISITYATGSFFTVCTTVITLPFTIKYKPIMVMQIIILACVLILEQQRHQTYFPAANTVMMPHR